MNMDIQTRHSVWQSISAAAAVVVVVVVCGGGSVERADGSVEAETCCDPTWDYPQMLTHVHVPAVRHLCNRVAPAIKILLNGKHNHEHMLP